MDGEICKIGSGLRMLEYEEAKEFVKTLGFKTWHEWMEYVAGRLKYKTPKPRNIPSFPYGTYKNKGWISMSDWLGVDEVDSGDEKIRDFNQAREFVRSLKLKSETRVD